VIICISISVGVAFYLTSNPKRTKRTPPTFISPPPPTFISPPPLTRVEQLIKDQTLTTTIKEKFENNNETAPNAKMLELYEKMINILPKSLKDKINCDTVSIKRNHMYNEEDKKIYTASVLELVGEMLIELERDNKLQKSKTMIDLKKIIKESIKKLES
jgi:hypothetical protein